MMLILKRLSLPIYAFAHPKLAISRRDLPIMNGLEPRTVAMCQTDIIVQKPSSNLLAGC